MGRSILAGRDRMSLENGFDLRLLSALEVLQARREADELAGDGRERALCSNACLLARALERSEDQTPVFSDGKAVLAGMTAEEIAQQLLKDGKITHIDPNFTRPRLTELKEAGKVKVVGKRRSEITSRNTAVWRVVKH